MSLTLTVAANAAALFLGVLDSGEELSTQQIADILAATNNWLDNLSSEGLFALSDLITTFTFTSGVQSYTIGTGQAINVARPVRIVAAAFKNSQGPGGPLKVATEKEWASIPDRQRTSWMLETLFWDRGTPNGNVLVSPVPQGAGLTGEIHTWVPLAQFADATTPITPAPGYARFIELGIAMEVASQFDMTPPASMVANFGDAAARIRKLNASLIGEVPEEVVQEAK